MRREEYRAPSVNPRQAEKAGCKVETLEPGLRKIDAHLRSSCDNIDPHGNAFGHVVFDCGESHDFASYERFTDRSGIAAKAWRYVHDARALCLTCRRKLR